ncbi:MAG: anti-sigma factor antagonist [Lachnospiraceae bacterium]|nr:anti-sigma factor antagonist [Lachnospiraceae bacterium]
MNSLFTVTGTVLCVHLPEEIDHHTANSLCAETDCLIQKKHIRSVLFDFSETTFMDSSGIGMLIGRYKLMRFMGGVVMAVNVGPRMKRILVMAGINKIMDIFEEMPILG